MAPERATVSIVVSTGDGTGATHELVIEIKDAEVDLTPTNDLIRARLLSDAARVTTSLFDRSNRKVFTSRSKLDPGTTTSSLRSAHARDATNPSS